MQEKKFWDQVVFLGVREISIGEWGSEIGEARQPIKDDA